MTKTAKVGVLKISAISPNEAPLELMGLADPSAGHIQSYLAESTIFIGEWAEEWVAVAAVMIAGTEMTLKNLAVKPEAQNLGWGTLMLTHLLDYAERLGLERVTVAISNSGVRHLMFYGRLGFRIGGIEPDFFIGYDPPIYEHGIRCLDRLHLWFDLRSSVGTRGGFGGRDTASPNRINHSGEQGTPAESRKPPQTVGERESLGFRASHG